MFLDKISYFHWKDYLILFYIEVLIKVITWMICSSHMKKQLSAYFRDVKEIQVLNDILTSYSHAKVNMMCKYDSLRILFEFFNTHDKDHFLSNFKGQKKEKYEEALDELIQNFEIEATSLASIQDACIM